MNATTSTTEIDFGELIQLVSREVDTAVSVSNLSADGGSKLQISSVKVRLGQSAIPTEENPPQGTVPPRSFLLKDRYALASKGWQFELDFKSGLKKTTARIGGEPGLPVTITPGVPVLNLFKDMPVTAIKGIDDKTSRIMKKFGVNVIAELARLKWLTVEKIIESTRSRRVIELRYKARLLGIAIPEIPESGAGEMSLYQLLEMSPQKLRSLIGKNILSATASEGLGDLLSLLYTVIDARVLKKISLDEMRNVTPDRG